MAHQESPLIKRLTIRLPLESYLVAMRIVEKRNMKGVGELIRHLLDEETQKAPLTEEEARTIQREVQRIVGKTE